MYSVGLYSINTSDRRQSKTLIKISTNVDLRSLETTVSIHCAPEMSEIDCIGRIESFWPKIVRGW